MAKPRVFLSSTFYDLRYIRGDLERFIRELGYEPILHERGQVPYGRNESLEQYCYREIGTCDIVVHIIGGRFGSPANEHPYSISQMELKKAHELQKQIYVFVERAVHVEYRTFLRNEKNQSFQPQYVDNKRIYLFLKEIYAFSTNNIVTDFDTVSEIITYLREQWAGLFQRFLQEDSKREEYKFSANLRATAETLSQLIKYTTTERDETIKSILVSGHPVFRQLADAAGMRIRVVFTTEDELVTLLETFGFKLAEGEDDASFFTYEGTWDYTKTTLKIDRTIFDESGKLRPLESDEWQKSFVSASKTQMPKEVDDVPF